MKREFAAALVTLKNIAAGIVDASLRPILLDHDFILAAGTHRADFVCFHGQLLCCRRFPTFSTQPEHPWFKFSQLVPYMPKAVAALRAKKWGEAAVFPWRAPSRRQPE